MGGGRYIIKREDKIILRVQKDHNSGFKVAGRQQTEEKALM